MSHLLTIPQKRIDSLRSRSDRCLSFIIRRGVIELILRFNNIVLQIVDVASQLRDFIPESGHRVLSAGDVRVLQRFVEVRGIVDRHAPDRERVVVR